MYPLAVSLIAFAVIFGGVLVGALLRNALPQHHLADGTKDVVRLGTGFIGSIAALVLGLLIASANGAYDSQSGKVRRIAADIILLDNMLMQYGPETQRARELLRGAIGPMVDRIWLKSGADPTKQGLFEATAVSEAAYAVIQHLSPQSDAQRSLKARALDISSDLAQARLLLFEQSGRSIPVPFLAVLVCWLAIIFASFSLFARLNATLIAVLFVFALSGAGALFLILELSLPFTGVMQISSTPLRNALPPLGP